MFYIRFQCVRKEQLRYMREASKYSGQQILAVIWPWSKNDKKKSRAEKMYGKC